MRAGATFVPIPIRLPAKSARAFVKDIALAGEHEIRLHGKGEFIQPMHDVPQVAPGIDRPEHAGLPQRAQQRRKARAPTGGVAK